MDEEEKEFNFSLHLVPSQHFSFYHSLSLSLFRERIKKVSGSLK